MNSFYELRPLPYAESGYGYPESGQTIVNVTNGKIIRLLVDDEPFDIRYGELRSHERVLDFRAGTLSRTAEWVSPAGQAERLAFVQVRAQPDVPIGEREDRLRLREHLEIELRLAHRPGLHDEGGLRAHESSRSSARSETTVSAPCSRRASA